MSMRKTPEDFSKFGKHFQESMVQLMLEDRAYCDQITEVLDTSFFELAYLQVFVNKVINYRKKYKVHPTYKTMITILRTELEGENDALQSQVKDYFSRIHAKDIAYAIQASINNPTPGEIFNITDDLPERNDLVADYAAKLMQINLEKIDISDKRVNEKVLEFYKENKKVSNKKIKKILSWSPQFKNYKIGNTFKNIVCKDTFIFEYSFRLHTARKSETLKLSTHCGL